MPTRWLARSRCLAAPLLAAALLSPACAPEARPLLWVVEAEPPSFLFGTIHVPDPRVTALPETVERAFAAADVVVTEIPLDQRADVAALMSSGRSLRELLPEPLHRRVTGYFQARGTSVARLDRLAIWAVVLQVLQLEVAALPGGGTVLDFALWQRAVAAGKQVAGLASVEEQMGAFGAFSVEEQRVMLTGTLDQLEAQQKTGRNQLADMIEVYRRGDLDELQRFALLSSGFEGHEELERKFQRVIIDQRNEQMADRMAARMRAEPAKSWFFAVGAMHCAGDRSLLALLRQRGYRVTRVP